MGIIETGTVSGNLPSKETFVVHYPGYPSSISRALETLGGIQGISIEFVDKWLTVYALLLGNRVNVKQA